MKRDEFRHVLRAVADATGHDQFVVIGSQAILGSLEDPPRELLESMEVDVYALHDPQAADRIDGALGDGSPFHAAFGYYAHGVSDQTAKPPHGWQDRLVRVEVELAAGTRHGEIAVALCLEPHDLVLSKCAAGRQRDWDYAGQALGAGVVALDVLLARVPGLPVPAEQREQIARNLQAAAAAARKKP